MYLTVSPPCGPGSTPDRGGVFQGIFPGWSHTLGEKMNLAESPQTQWKDMRNRKQHSENLIQILFGAKKQWACFPAFFFITFLAQ